MPAPAALTARRLVGALEDLAARESLLLGGGYYPEAIAIQRRSAPLLARLGELTDALEHSCRQRVEALLARRRETAARLLARRSGLAGERQRLALARRRLREIAAYSQATARVARRRLDAAV